LGFALPPVHISCETGSSHSRRPANQDFVENQIEKGATQVKPVEDVASFPPPTEIKKPSKDQGLFNGAGEEGRTPDLMLGKHTL
jgi:hypothetical protein